MNKLYFRALRSSIYGFFAMAALLFVPAGTLDYWQAYVFMAVFVGGSTAITVYLAIKDPKLLERRMKVGPTAEKEPTQKIIMVFALLGFIALLVVPALDRRFMWSSVPIQVAEGQTVVSTGPYAVVRHPMYAGVLPLLIGTPLALGSWCGLGALILFMPALIWRLLDEERFLHKNLPGYTEYTQKVRYRLVPFVW